MFHFVSRLVENDSSTWIVCYLNEGKLFLVHIFWKPKEVQESFVFDIFPEAPDNDKAVQFADYIVDTCIAHTSHLGRSGHWQQMYYK